MAVPISGLRVKPIAKPARISTGFELPVPMFVDIGDKIEIDTRTAEYKNRVK